MNTQPGVEITRRGLLAGAVAGGIGAMLPMRVAAGQPAAGGGAVGGRKRSLRVAHLSDTHVQPERRAADGLAACLTHVNAMADKPDLIVTGGDLVMDSAAQKDARTALQWELFTKTVRDNNGIAIEHCLGNHDFWGLDKKKSETTGSEPNFGKKRALEVLGLPERYRSFDRGGWHVVVLDSVTPEGDGYIGQLDETQWEWLKGDLAAVAAGPGGGLPVLVVSHIPIVSLPAALVGPNKETGKRELSRSIVHIDGAKIVGLFAKHRNVKLCLSGHVHEIDRMQYQGVTYICDGAVSGNWWKGRHKECDEGYGVVDLFDDGTFEHQYVTYGWKAAPNASLEAGLYRA